MNALDEDEQVNRVGLNEFGAEENIDDELQNNPLNAIAASKSESESLEGLRTEKREDGHQGAKSDMNSPLEVMRAKDITGMKANLHSTEMQIQEVFSSDDTVGALGEVMPGGVPNHVPDSTAEEDQLPEKFKKNVQKMVENVIVLPKIAQTP